MARVAILHYSRLNTRVSYVEQILSIKITFIPFAQLPVNLLGSLCPLIMHTVKSSNAFAENSISAASSSYPYTYTHMIRRISSFTYSPRNCFCIIHVPFISQTFLYTGLEVFSTGGGTIFENYTCPLYDIFLF